MAVFNYVNEPYKKLTDVGNVINYVTNPLKTKSGYIGGSAIFAYSPEDIINQFIGIKRLYNNATGNQLKHFIVSFDHYYEKKVTPEVAFQFAQHVAIFLNFDFQLLYAVHEDASNIHIHFVFNTVSYLTGKKYTSDKKDFYYIRDAIWYACRIYELGVNGIINPAVLGK